MVAAQAHYQRLGFNMTPLDILNQTRANLALGSPLDNFLRGRQAANTLQAQELSNEALTQKIAQAAAMNPLQLQAQQQAVQAGQMELDDFQKERALKGVFDLVTEAEALSPDNPAQYIRERVGSLDIPGSRDLAEDAASMTDEELTAFIPQIKQFAAAKGYSKAKPRFTGVEVDPDSGYVVYTNTDTGETSAQPIGEFNLGGMSPKDRREFQKETRTSLRGDVGKVKKEAEDLLKARDKIGSLITSAKAGNRTSIAAVIMNVARLNSPGVVTDNDFAQMAGSQNPVAFALSLISSKGVDPDALFRGFDPTNPETFDADGVIKTADSLITSQIPVLAKSLDGLKEKARIAEIPENQVDTIFAGTDFIGDVKGLGSEGQQGPIDDNSARLNQLREKFGL